MTCILIPGRMCQGVRSATEGCRIRHCSVHTNAHTQYDMRMQIHMCTCFRWCTCYGCELELLAKQLGSAYVIICGAKLHYLWSIHGLSAGHPKNICGIIFACLCNEMNTCSMTIAELPLRSSNSRCYVNNMGTATEAICQSDIA